MAELPKAEWTQREDLARLVDVLGRENLRWVGGAVRDTLLGKPVKDIDAATPLRPDEVVARLKGQQIRSVPTGIELRPGVSGSASTKPTTIVEIDDAGLVGKLSSAIVPGTDCSTKPTYSMSPTSAPSRFCWPGGRAPSPRRGGLGAITPG